VVVVYLGGVLSRMRAQDSSHVLHEASLEGDRRREEQGIQCRAVESLADERSGGDGEQR